MGPKGRPAIFDTVVLATSTALYRLDMEPLPVQIEALMREQDYPEALALATALDDPRYISVKDAKVSRPRAPPMC
jgi:hypothetical protein